MELKIRTSYTFGNQIDLVMTTIARDFDVNGILQKVFLDI